MSTGEESSFLKIIDRKYKISKRGRSLQVTIPSNVVKKLKIEKGDYVKFVMDEENEIAMIMKKNKLPVATVKIDGVTRRAMYFASKRIKAEEITKEEAEAHVRGVIQNLIKECKEIGGTTAILNKRLQEIIEYHDIDISPFIDESEGIKIRLR